MIVGLVGRHEIGDVAQHEQLAGPSVEDHLRRDAGIAAAHDHRRRPLPLLGERAETLMLLAETSGEKILVSFDEMSGKWVWAYRRAVIVGHDPSVVFAARDTGLGAPIRFPLCWSRGLQSKKESRGKRGRRQTGKEMIPKLKRSVLAMPGSNARALEKGKSLAADALMFELEDGVAESAKTIAREQVVAGAQGRRLWRAPDPRQGQSARLALVQGRHRRARLRPAGTRSSSPR